MLFSVLCYSFVPLLIVAAGGVDHPFFFNFAYRFGAFVGGFIFLLFVCRDLLLDPAVRGALWRRVRRWDFPLLLLPYFGYTAFAWSATLVDVSLTTVIVEAWPLFYIPLVEWLLRGENRYLRATPARMLPVFLAFAGFVLVVSSQAGGIGRLGALGAGPLMGVCLALLGSLSSTSSAYNVRWASDLRGDLQPLVSDVGEYRLELFGMMFAFTLGSLVSALVNLSGEFLIVGWWGSGSPVELGEALFTVVVGGVLLDMLGTLGQRTAVYRAVNALGYAIPLFSLTWIWLFWRIGVARPDYLLLGAVMIVVANLLVTLGGGGESRWWRSIFSRRAG